MPNNAEIMKEAIERFERVQDYMLTAKKEKAVETYDKLKKEYLSLKTLLQTLGVSMVDIDQIKE